MIENENEWNENLVCCLGSSLKLRSLISSSTITKTKTEIKNK